MSTTTNMWPALGLGIQDLRNDGVNETATTTSFANAATTIDDGKRNKQRNDGRGDQKTAAAVDSTYDDDDRFSSIVDDTTADSSAYEENAIGTEITIGTFFDNAAAATSSGELSPSLPPRKMRQQRCRKRAMTPATIEENDAAVDDRDDDAVAVAAAAKKSRRDVAADSCEFENRPEGSAYGGSNASDEIPMHDLWSELTGPDATVDDSNVLETDQMFKTVNNDHSMAGVLDGFEMRSVYALLSRIDSAKCVQEYDGLGGERAAEHIRRLVRTVLWSLWRLGRFASRHRFDINLSSRAWLDLNETFGGGGGGEEKTAAAATRTEADETTKRSLLLGGDDEIEVGGGGEPAKERVRTLIGNLDHGVKELILRLVQVRGSKVYEDLLEERLTALNFTDSENKLSYAGYAIGRMRFVQFRNNIAYMNGFYLVSLKPMQLTRVLKYPAYEDRFGYLGQIARQYVKDKIYRGKRIPDRVRIFVNLTTLQACQDFNVLKSLPTSVLNDIKREDAAIEVVNNVSGGKSGSGNKKPIGRLDRSGVLGLVQFGNVRYEPKNEYVVIRGYLAATFSSTCAE